MARRKDADYGNHYALRMDYPASRTVSTSSPIVESGHKIMVGINAGEADEIVDR
jgi:hypothetical protein